MQVFLIPYLLLEIFRILFSRMNAVIRMYASASRTAAAMVPLKKRLFVKSSIRSRKNRNSLRGMDAVVTSLQVPISSLP